MFESLDERVKQDSAETRTERILKYAAVLALLVLMFGGLYLGLKLLD